MPTLSERRRRQQAVYDRLVNANRRRDSSRLIRKQVSDHADWLRVWSICDQMIPRQNIDALIDETVENIKQTVAGKRAAFAWSGGKDSLALEFVANAAGVTECCFVMTALEYPEFLKWATDNMPDGCEVFYRSNINLIWLNDHPEMLFPPDSAAAAKWFSSVQHAGQKEYYAARSLDILLYGRRRMDGNFIPKGDISYSRERGVSYCPIADWTHEQVLALLKHYEIPLPPTYSWPRGFQVGTGPWPARQWTRSVEHGWAEIYEIDRSIVHDAAAVLPSAKTYLDAIQIQETA